MQPIDAGRPKALRLAWLAPLVLVAACAAQPTELVEEEPEPVEEVLVPDLPETPGEPVRPNRAGPPKPVPPLALTTIVGLDEARTLELLGTPEDVRVEAPATIWSYLREDCRLDIYFYPSLRERRLQSLTYEMVGAEEPDTCLSAFGIEGNGSS